MKTLTTNMTFVPEKPVKYVDVRITVREADLLMKLRRYPFGKFIIHKAGGTLIRVEVNDSQLIDENTEIDL